MIRVQKFLPQNLLRPISKLKLLVFNTLYELRFNKLYYILCLIICKSESQAIDKDLKIRVCNHKSDDRR